MAYTSPGRAKRAGDNRVRGLQWAAAQSITRRSKSLKSSREKKNPSERERFPIAFPHYVDRIYSNPICPIYIIGYFPLEAIPERFQVSIEMPDIQLARSDHGPAKYSSRVDDRDSSVLELSTGAGRSGLSQGQDLTS
ncbi:hypothetical protein CRG98_024766 [Punica granatum]|uniref:Uncharacterized protein n=1 Tax=Punica granatum TaxID=22663 RepID=A0A2I0JEY0_PUNGR|nr:hypothetical protein CRG98_024766 [Punica granatum]